MKYLLRSCLALAAFALTNTNLRADTLDLSLMTGTNVDVLHSHGTTQFDGVSADVYTYVHTQDCVLGLGGCSSVLGSTTSTVTVTYAQVSDILTVINVNDVCAQVVVLGSAPGCQSFAFSATGVTLGNGELGIASADVLALLDVSLGVGTAGEIISGNTDGPAILALGVHGASDQFDFNAPPPPPPPSAATPEPSSLCLLASGLMATAGVVRRRFQGATNNA